MHRWPVESELDVLGRGPAVSARRDSRGQDGSGLKEAEQESHEAQIEVANAQRGVGKGVAQHETRVPHGRLKLNDLAITDLFAHKY